MGSCVCAPASNIKEKYKPPKKYTSGDWRLEILWPITCGLTEKNTKYEKRKKNMLDCLSKSTHMSGKNRLDVHEGMCNACGASPLQSNWTNGLGLYLFLSPHGRGGGVRAETHPPRCESTPWGEGVPRNPKMGCKKIKIQQHLKNVYFWPEQNGPGAPSPTLWGGMRPQKEAWFGFAYKKSHFVYMCECKSLSTVRKIRESKKFTKQKMTLNWSNFLKIWRIWRRLFLRPTEVKNKSSKKNTLQRDLLKNKVVWKQATEDGTAGHLTCTVRTRRASWATPRDPRAVRAGPYETRPKRAKSGIK